ncbi:MAG: UPF0182 family protein [Candidatus Eremiobacteraeota bacterium]|nr:UPF0182 family protein [Candidatus Eremiobacteraeota bacterium]
MKTKNLWKWILAGVIFTVLFFFWRIVYLITEWLWYRGNGYEAVFNKLLWSQVICGFSIGLLFFIVIGINHLLAMKFRSKAPQFLGDNVLQMPGVFYFDHYMHRVGLIFCICVAFLAGLEASTRWDLFLKAMNPVAFGLKDPLFGLDVSFYVFLLPLFEYLSYGAFVLVLISLLYTTVIYILGRGIHYTPKEFYVPKNPKIHILVLITLMLAVKAWGYHLSQYRLLFSKDGLVFGAMYTDVFAVLPFLKFAVIICIIGAVVVLFDAFTRYFRFTLGTVLAVLLVSLIGGVVYPGIMQKFLVAPNELNKEKPFIARNIDFTRYAFGLDRIEEQEFSANEDLRWADIEKNNMTIKNVRLWDHKPLLETYSELQEIRTYYNFFDVDNDRYIVNGEYRQTMLSPRELSYEKLPDKKWINQTFIYTHGYGGCLGPVNKVTEDGLPEFFIKDIPPLSSASISLTRPEIYFGEMTNTYSIVNSGVKEFDYPFGDKNMYCQYQGSGGFPIDSFWKRLLFAFRFHELKIMLSTDIKPTSRILFYRNINEAIKRITPYVHYDSDPYMVISEGRLFWIVDGYTISANYPYSQPIPELGNYIRNSVKVVIDAYNGTMKFYISDASDPLISCYSTIFPGVFEPIAKMPPDLRAHMRYPEGFFYAQALMYATYHMTDPQVFYNKEDLWKIPAQRSEKHEGDMRPYYTILKFPPPHGNKEEFILMIPFTPSRKANMIAWMAARCDAPHYGKILVYSFPKDKLIYGPQQIDSRIDQDPEISKQLSLWGQGGSEVIRGSLLVIPIEDSLLYIEPLYLAAEKGKIPQLKRVLVVYGSNVAMEENLEASLRKVFTVAGGPVPSTGDFSGEPKGQGYEPGEDMKTLIIEANRHYDKARAFQREENWSGYGEEMKHLRAALEQLKKLSEKQATPDEGKLPRKDSDGTPTPGGGEQGLDEGKPAVK